MRKLERELRARLILIAILKNAEVAHINDENLNSGYMSVCTGKCSTCSGCVNGESVPFYPHELEETEPQILG